MRSFFRLFVTVLQLLQLILSLSALSGSFGILKSALRLWFKTFAFRQENDDARYRIFLADVINKDYNSYCISDALSVWDSTTVNNSKSTHAWHFDSF